MKAAKGEVRSAGLLFLSALLASPASAQPAGQDAGLGCVFDALTPAERGAVAVDYSQDDQQGRSRVAAALASKLTACSTRFGWDDGRRRWAADYAGQRAELEARAPTLPAPASADRLQSLFDALPESDRRGMGAGGELDEAAFRAIGLRLKQAFQSAAIPESAQGPAAGYLLALAHLRQIEAAWAALQPR